jgi:protein pelota
MRILKEDLKGGTMKVQPDSPEDLWLLSTLLSVGDEVRGSTERKVAIGGGDERSRAVTRRMMTLTVKTEKAEYGEDSLRILGTITDGPDDVPRGDHHTITIKEGDAITILKDWPSWQAGKIHEAATRRKETVLVVLFDREEALFALLTGRGSRIVGTLKGEVQKKAVDTAHKGDHWQAIANALKEYDERHSPSAIVAGSPAFWKEYVKAALPESLQRKVIFTAVSDVNEQALAELPHRPELKAALAADRGTREQHLIMQLLGAVAKDAAAYGLKEVERRAAEGALNEVLVSDTLIAKTREEGTYTHLDALLRAIEQGKATIHLITTKEARAQLDGLGGIAGLTRW